MASMKMSQKKNSLEGPKPSFFKKIQNYIDYNNATTRTVTNPSVASKLKKALEDIVTANEDSKKKKKAAMRLEKFGKKLPKLEEERRKKIAKDKAKIKKTIKLKANMLQELKEKKEQGGGAKDLVHEKIMIAQDIAEELYQKFQRKKNKTDDVKDKLKLYKEIDDELIKGAGEHSKKEKKKKRTLSKKQTLAHFQKLKKNDEGHKNNAMNSILKTLVEAIGKDSAGAMKARADLQRLLKKYPNQVPTALIGIVRAKLKKNGLGIILAIQLSATMIGLLLSIIPIPGLAIIGEAVAIAANMGTDLLVAVGPEQIIALLQNGSQKALEAFTKSMVPLIESVSGAFCCNSSGDKKNMEKFGKIMEHLIELEKIKNKEEAKAKIEAYIKEIQGVMSKPVPGVDMAALDKLIKKYPPPKDNEKGKTTDAKPKIGGKRRKTRKRRKRKTKKRRRKRRKRKTNKYRNKFTRRY
jgi:hypothetical protein